MVIPRNDPTHPRWFHINWWFRDIYYFFIRADVIDYIDLDIRRIKWDENLKIIPIFTFWITDPKKKITKDGKEVSLNRWIYERVLIVLPQDRIAMFGRRSTTTTITEDLPMLPKVYHMLETNKNPPSFKKVKACDYHYYVDDHPDVSAEDDYE